MSPLLELQARQLPPAPVGKCILQVEAYSMQDFNNPVAVDTRSLGILFASPQEAEVLLLDLPPKAVLFSPTPPSPGSPPTPAPASGFFVYEKKPFHYFPETSFRAPRI